MSDDAPKKSNSWRRAAGRALRVGSHVLGRTHERLADARRTTAFLAGLYEFQPRKSDIYIATYPRSGTTWMQFLIYLLVEPRADPFDFEHIGDVSPWFERSLAIGTHCASDFEKLASPRIFKTHLVPGWLPRQGRFVHVVRDVLDVARSYYAFYRSHLGFRGSLSEFLASMDAGRLQYGSWHAHHARWQSPRRGQRVLELEYEALVADGGASLRRVADFLELDVDDSRIHDVLACASFEQMKRHEHKFDHATAILRERGIRSGEFIRQGPNAAKDQTLPAEWVERLRAPRVKFPRRFDLPLFLH